MSSHIVNQRINFESVKKRDGKLVRYVDNRALKDLLETIFVRGGASPLALLKRRVKNEEKH